jgi:acid phosphatase family membrane protein YuiD
MEERNIFAELLSNRHFLTAFVGLASAQVLKVFFDYWRTNSWRTAMLTSTGGMPSSHSSFVVSLMISIGIYEGFGTVAFAISAALALVVMHDAAGIRRAAGKQAEAINFLFSKLEKQGIKLDHKLKELLGHRPLEVFAGAILGIIVALAAYWLFPVGGVYE